MTNLARKGPIGIKDRTPKKDPAYLAKVATLPCCVCQAFGLVQIGPTYVHHTICGRFSQAKTPDREAVPLCFGHHQGEFGIHTDKAAWVQEYGLDTDYIAATQDRLK
jgi:hypothetical protein